MVPTGYDAITLNHWLWWKLRCFEAGGEEFQKLFEALIKRSDPKFMSIRPYGRSGTARLGMASETSEREGWAPWASNEDARSGC